MRIFINFCTFFSNLIKIIIIYFVFNLFLDWFLSRVIFFLLLLINLATMTWICTVLPILLHIYLLLSCWALIWIGYLFFFFGCYRLFRLYILTLKLIFILLFSELFTHFFIIVYFVFYFTFDVFYIRRFTSLTIASFSGLKFIWNFFQIHWSILFVSCKCWLLWVAHYGFIIDLFF